MAERALGSSEQAERVLRELYVDLRRSLRLWSEVTFQTPQPRMGYIGQHLTSVVTGLQGGRSGARGHDLLAADGRFAEIKTCYRVDQLGACANCGQVVASFELACPVCSSQLITRKDDSKWLISPKHDEDMRGAFSPFAYFLVLFDFEDLAQPTTTNARIWTVDPLAPGFCLAIIDYYENIRSKSRSKAAFNLWPFALKFYLMRPELRYWAVIADDDTITTKFFAARGKQGELEALPSLALLEKSKIPVGTLLRLATRHGVDTAEAHSNSDLLRRLQAHRTDEAWESANLADEFAWKFYTPLIGPHLHWLPPSLHARLEEERAALGPVD